MDKPTIQSVEREYEYVGMRRYSYGNLNSEKHKTFPKTEMPLNLQRNLAYVEH